MTEAIWAFNDRNWIGSQFFKVGLGGVQEITFRDETEQGRSTVKWFDVWAEPMGRLWCSVNEQTVAKVVYKLPENEHETN